jgi:hypothetical protein
MEEDVIAKSSRAIPLYGDGPMKKRAASLRRCQA